MFVSTACFEQDTLTSIIALCEQLGGVGLECSSGVKYSSHNVPAMLDRAAQGGLPMLAHNYFPPPEDPFVFNLASTDAAVLSRSMGFAKAAVDLTQTLGAPLYSVHAGYCFHAAPGDLGRPQVELPRIPRPRALETLVSSLRELAEYAHGRGIRVAMENNVLSPFNRVDSPSTGFADELLLGVRPQELLAIVEEAGRDNLGILLDVAHLKVSARSLGFVAHEGVARIGSRVMAVHLSDNSGQADSGDPVRPDSWFWEPLDRHVRKDVPLVLETRPQCVDAIRQQLGIINEFASKDR